MRAHLRFDLSKLPPKRQSALVAMLIFAEMLATLAPVVVAVLILL